MKRLVNIGFIEVGNIVGPEFVTINEVRQCLKMKPMH